MNSDEGVVIGAAADAAAVVVDNSGYVRRAKAYVRSAEWLSKSALPSLIADTPNLK
jgi:hypothetical protein